MEEIDSWFKETEVRKTKNKDVRKWEKENLSLPERFPNVPYIISVIALIASIVVPLLRQFLEEMT